MSNPPLNQPAIIQRISLPKDANAQPIPLVPAKVALEETYDTTVSSSTEITLNASTTLIEVSAISQPIFMKWGVDDASSTDWDYVIQAGTTRHFMVPVDNTTGVLLTAVNFIEQAASATLCVSEF